jgi:GGDEF domain-containing protein
MAEVESSAMQRRKRSIADDVLPQTPAELAAWIREHFELPASLERQLLDAVDAVCTRNQRLWQESKEEAVHALSASFAEQMARVRDELSARDATVSSISRYFEKLVADLTDRSHRDPKTKLMNFVRFTDQLESFLALEQRGRWSAVGLVDIKRFKAYNDTLGHAAGDRIIERVAQLLSEHVRSDDVLARDQMGRGSQGTRAAELHARFGGDEFCFFIPALAEWEQARTVGERFRKAVEQYDWTQEDARLTEPVRVDVGVVCLSLGPLAARRSIAHQLAAGLVQRADQMMYEAKGSRTHRIRLVRVAIKDQALVDIAHDVLHS